MNLFDSIRALLSEGHTQQEVADQLLISRGKLQRTLKKGKSPVRNTVLAIGDIHEPFSHPDYFEFIKDVASVEGAHEFVFIGDIVDNHALSRYPSETQAFTVSQEGDAAAEALAKWGAEFPKAKICRGNHDFRAHKIAKDYGIGDRYIKSMNEIYDLPSTWEWGDSHMIDEVLYIHGTEFGGKYAHVNAMERFMRSVVMGHTHSNGGVQYRQTRDALLFGAQTGCGVDSEKYAFHYARGMPYKPTLGCVVVKDGKRAQFIPMEV